MKEHLPLPELTGTHGRAWRVFPAGKNPRTKGDVVQWMIEAKWAHPFWDSYWLSLLNLSSIDGVPDAKFYLEGATHEVILHALDPSKPRRIYEIPNYIVPANFAGQFIADSDEDAEARITETVREVINGTLNPDTDFIKQWIERYGDHMVIK